MSRVHQHRVFPYLWTLHIFKKFFSLSEMKAMFLEYLDGIKRGIGLAFQFLQKGVMTE